MLTLKIDNSEIEKIFTEGFESNKDKFFNFIKNSYKQKISLQSFEENKNYLNSTYEKIKDGSIKTFSEVEAEYEIDRFLETL